MLHYERDTGNQSKARRPADSVTVTACTANTPTSITVPAGADLVVFSSTGQFFAGYLTTAQAAQLVANGGLASAASWNVDSGDWVISGGHATATTASDTLNQALSNLIPGQAYTVAFDCTQSAGSVQVSLGGTAGTSRSTSATFTETIIAGSSNANVVFTGTGFSGTIDNVAVTAVGSLGANAAGQGPEMIQALVPEESRTRMITGKNVILVEAGATNTITSSFFKN